MLKRRCSYWRKPYNRLLGFLCLLVTSYVIYIGHEHKLGGFVRPELPNIWQVNSIYHSLILAHDTRNQTSTIKQASKYTVRIRHRFKFVIDMPAVCTLQKRNISIELLVFITTSYEHRSKRESLRNSWLMYSRNNTSNFRYIFILGETDNKTLFENITKEAREYHDILVANFQDMYRNLTLKTIAGFHWANETCAHARFVMKTDDDVYVNIPGLLNKLENENESFSFGKLWRNVTPHRNESRKWFISYEQYPNTAYPDYFDGLGYVLSMKHVQGILNIYPTVNFLPFEDIYVGMCLKQIGFSFETKEFYLFIREGLIFSPCFYKYSNVIAAHEVPGPLMKTILNEPCRVGEFLSRSSWLALRRHIKKKKKKKKNIFHNIEAEWYDKKL